MPWPYCPASDFTLWVDARAAAQLLSDSDATDLPEGDIPASGLLIEALKEGAAELDQELTEHLRYDLPTLMAIAAPPAQGPDPGVWLRKMNAARAVVSLQQRRIRPRPEADQLVANLVEWSERQLERVHAGKNVLPAPPSAAQLASPLSAADAAANLAVGQAAALPATGTFDQDNAGGWLHPRGFGSDTNPRRTDGVDTLNQGYRDG